MTYDSEQTPRAPIPLRIVHRALPDPSIASNEVPLLVDRFTLAKRRWQGAATDGTAFGFDLEAPLHHRDIFFTTETTQYYIAQKPEPTLEISLDGIQSAARIAWSLGNLHFAIQVSGKIIRVADDSAIRLLLERNHIAFVERTTVFHPIQAAPAHGHSH